MNPNAKPLVKLTRRLSIDPYAYFIACLFSKPKTFPLLQTVAYFISILYLGALTLLSFKNPLSTLRKPNLGPISPPSTPGKLFRFLNIFSVLLVQEFTILLKQLHLVYLLFLDLIITSLSPAISGDPDLVWADASGVPPLHNLSWELQSDGPHRGSLPSYLKRRCLSLCRRSGGFHAVVLACLIWTLFGAETPLEEAELLSS